MQKRLESFVRCEEQLWPECGGPSNTFLPPRPRRQSHPNPFLVEFRPKLKCNCLLQKFIPPPMVRHVENWLTGGSQRGFRRGRRGRVVTLLGDLVSMRTGSPIVGATDVLAVGGGQATRSLGPPSLWGPKPGV